MAYTFKDDGHALTFYREYNKEVGTGDKTLVGNWVEERALRDVCETGRCARATTIGMGPPLRRAMARAPRVCREQHDRVARCPRAGATRARSRARAVHRAQVQALGQPGH